MVENIRAKQGRGLAGNFRHLALIPLGLDCFEQLAVKGDCPRLVVLG